MYIPSKVAKSNLLQQDRVQNYQNAASKYYKQYSKLKKKYDYNKFQQKQTYISLREDVISWFFSLDLVTRCIVSSIENKWVTSLLHQLYIQQKREPSQKFQIKEDLLSFYSQNANSNIDNNQHIFRLTANDNYNNIISGTNQNNINSIDMFSYLRYFNSKQENSDKDNIIDKKERNNVSVLNAKNINENFLNELKFYKSEESILGSVSSEQIETYSNYFTLSETILQDENLFKSYFIELSNDYAFTQLIPAVYDTNSKYYNLFLPEWLKVKEFYSASEIFSAFFEQVILVKYVLSNFNQNMPKLKSHLENLLKEEVEIFNFINKYEKPGSTLFEFVKEKNLVQNLLQNKKISDLVMAKLYQGNASFFFDSAIKKSDKSQTILDKENMDINEIEKNLEKYLLNFDSCKDRLVKELTYINISKIFSYDDFLLRQIYECLLLLRQKESYEELINDNNSSEEYYKINLKSSAKLNKKKNKTKNFNHKNSKGTRNKFQIPIENCLDKNDLKQDSKKFEENIVKFEQYTRSFIRRKKQNNSNQANDNDQVVKINNIYTLLNDKESDYFYIRKEFLGNILNVKQKKKFQSELIVEDNEDIESIVQVLLDDIISNICNSFELENDKEIATNYTSDNVFEIFPQNNTDKNNRHTDVIMNNMLANGNDSDFIPIDSKINIHQNICPPLLSNTENIKIPEIKADIPINETISRIEINSDTNTHNIIINNMYSPCCSEKNENNDTDTAYSSEDTLSCIKSTTGTFNKLTKNKIFLYNVNVDSKANKNINKESKQLIKVNSESRNAQGKKLTEPKYNNQENKSNLLPIISNHNELSQNKNTSKKSFEITNTKNINSKVFQSDAKFGYKKSNSDQLNILSIKSPSKFNTNNPNKYSSHFNKSNNNRRNNNYNKFSDVNGYNKNNAFELRNINFNNYNTGGLRLDQLYQIDAECLNSFTFDSAYQQVQYPCIPNDFYIQHNPITFEYFYQKLHNDILEYYDSTETILKQIKPFKTLVVSYLEKEIINFFNTDKNFNFKVEVELYGSYASDLDIECSDIDMSICFESKVNYDFLSNGEHEFISKMAKLVENFNKLNVFEMVNPIYTASVPVIKLVIDPNSILDETNREKLNEFKKSLNYQNYKFDRVELEKIKIDITFLDLIKLRNNKNNNIPLNQVMFVKSSCLQYPEIKQMTKFLKRFFQLNELNSTFNGGLSSFSIFLLILACVKIYKLNTNQNMINLGKLFVEFLLYYGSFIDFNYTVVDVNYENPFILCSQPLEVIPSIIDPVSYYNIGKSSYRFFEVKNMLNMTYEYLNNIKMIWDKNQFNSNENIVNLLLLGSKK